MDGRGGRQTKKMFADTTTWKKGIQEVEQNSFDKGYKIVIDKLKKHYEQQMKVAEKLFLKQENTKWD